MRRHGLWWGRVGILVGAVWMLNGCWIVEIRPRPQIPIPPQLSPEDAEMVLLYELMGQPLPVTFARGERLGDEGLNAFVGGRTPSAQTQRVWFLESVDSPVLTVGYLQGHLYLRVAVRFQPQGVDLRIVDSKHLSQEGGKIHEVALIWVDELEASIRRALGQAATVRRLGMERR